MASQSSRFLHRPAYLLGVLLLAAIQVAACSSSDDSLGDVAAEGGGYGGYGTGGSSAAGGSTATGGAAPEQELEQSFQAPVASGRYLWTANPASNRVALVDADRLSVTSLEGGDGPTYLAALPATKTLRAGAAVINVRGRNASLFSLPTDTASSEPPVTLPLYGAPNSWNVSATGAFAIAWIDAKKATTSDPTDGYQDVTVIDRRGKAPVAMRLSVGYRPSQVFINKDESAAFVVSEPGISVVDLKAVGGPAVVRELFLPEQTVSAPRDVSFAPTGALAFVRIEGEKRVWVVDTATDERVIVALPQPVTDLDVSEDGSRAVAVMRSTGEAAPDLGTAGVAGSAPDNPDGPSLVAVLPVATIFQSPTTFATFALDELFGSAVLSKDGKRALLFTNGTAHETLGILDLESGSHRELDLKAPVKAAFLSNDGASAVVLLSPPSGSVKRGAFALVPIDKVLPPRIEGTEAPTFQVAMARDPASAVITTQDDQGTQHAAYLASFPSLSVERFALPSKPLATGVVPEVAKAFVSEAHPEGRITFVDLHLSTARTLTGFELGAKVVDGQGAR